MWTTCDDWIRKLEAESLVIAGMDLRKRIAGTTLLKNDAASLANCEAHCRLIVRAVEGLAANEANRSGTYLRDVLCSLIQRETYGAFAELAAYDWLARCYVAFESQVELTSNDVLGVNGVTLDGKMRHGAYFDVKAFGFNERLAQRLKELLDEEFPAEQVLITESWDLSVTDFSALIASASTIVRELRSKRLFRRGRLLVRLVPKQPGTVSHRSLEPYRLAHENARYPFRDAKQFAKNAPFILLFIRHPWFSPGNNHTDFGGTETTFTRSLARRAFMQFSGDTTPLETVCSDVPPDATLADASRLLSAIFFVNVWPPEADPGNPRKLPSWLYLNPRATHPLTRGSLSLFRSENRHGTVIYDFVDDDY
jgi:hypothetical protein